MNDITARISDILEATPAARHPMAFATERDWATAVAEQIVAQLQLTPEWTVELEATPTERVKCVPTPFPPRGELLPDDVVFTRLVSPWVVVEGEKP